MKTLIRELILESIRELKTEGVTSFLTKTTDAEKVAKILWKTVDYVDILRNENSFNDYVVNLTNGRKEYLRQYHNGKWFYFDQNKKSFQSADAILKKNVDEITTTGAVQGYMTPGAFKPTRKKRSVKEHPLNNDLGSIELVKKALSRVQYDKNMAVNLLVQKSKEAGGSQKKIYQTAITLLNGMNNSDIKNMISSVREEEQPEPYDSETDTFAPGPRQRPEDWNSMNKKMKRRTNPDKNLTIDSPKVHRALGDIAELPRHEYMALFDRARKAHRFFPDSGTRPDELNLGLALQYLSERP